MKEYNKINNIAGWIVFLISALLYLYTMEASVSLWDCGEFAAASYKLEVGHPPGAPLFLMLGRIFSLLTQDPKYIAICINSLSALASGFTVLFLFWTITQLTRRILFPEGIVPTGERWKIIFCGIIGSLSFAVSDSFWFSAVEAEVYALSGLFTALVFWAILKWDEDKGAFRHRWIVLIAYLLGLSVGIHLLNLLAIPAIILVIYFRNYGFNIRRFLGMLIISFFILLFVLYFVLPGTIKFAAISEILCVNSLHFPVNTGLICFIVLAVLLFVAFIRLTIKHEAKDWNLGILCLAMLLTGYSSYAMILIRAQANPPINTGNPSQIFSVLSYLQRDQYGSCPLFYGPYFNAPVKVTDSDNQVYIIRNGRYVTLPPKKIYQYNENFKTFFPRMYSNNPDHIKVYQEWGSVKGHPVSYKREDGTAGILMKPTFFENLQFFMTYQVGYMYLRYFLWNFSGKQNDMQANGGIMKGNWITGIDFVDRWMIGSQQQLPSYMKNNTGHNRYFMLPLLLGIIGLIYHIRKHRQFFWIVFTLFLFTGLAIVVYTNQTPLQPRERDYVYVGSFYTFCIWMGIGFLPIFQWMVKTFSKRLGAFIAIIFTGIIPLLMGAQNFDDHNRHGRKFVRDIAYNYLNTCAPNAILFTLGDNDTFPLWYMQEVEGFRTDVRIINLSLLGADWYAKALIYKYNHSDGIPCKSAFNDKSWIYIENKSFQPVSLDSLIASYTTLDSNRYIENDRYINRDIFIRDLTTNSEVKQKPSVFHLPGNYLMYNQMVSLEVICMAGKERPVYFTGLGQRITLGLDSFTRLDGFSYRLTGKKTDQIDTELLYRNLMENSQWDDFINCSGMVDDHLRNMVKIMRIRQNFAILAKALAAEGKIAKGLDVLQKVRTILPFDRFPMDGNCIPMAEAYYLCGDTKAGDRLVDAYTHQLKEELYFYNHVYEWMNDWVVSEKSTTSYYLEKLSKLKRNYAAH